MKHVSQQMISMELRRPYLKRRRRQLQRQMRHPGLDPEARRRIEREIHNLGDPKVYSADDPPPPGAMFPGPMPAAEIDIPPDSSIEQLSAIPHTRLYLYALKRDLDVHPGNTKIQVAKAVLDHLRGEEGEHP